MTPIEALEIASKSEKEALANYKRMVEEHPSIRDLCIELQNEEYKYKKLIEKRIQEITKY